MIGLKAGLPLFLLAQLALSSDDVALVRGREGALAAAIKTNDENVLLSLTDEDFHVSWSYGSAIRNVRTDVSRQEWIKGLGHLRIESYKVETGSLQPAERPGTSRTPSSAYVRLSEFWILRSPQGRRIEKRFDTVDLWIERQGAWKLASRLCQSDPP